jgi:flap endonuclease GEN
MVSGDVSDKKPELDGESEAEVIILDDDDDEEEATVNCESADSLDDPELPQVLRDDNGTFLLTDEDIQLVDAAFPNEAQRFQAQQVHNCYFLRCDRTEKTMMLSGDYNELLIYICTLASLFLEQKLCSVRLTNPLNFVQRLKEEKSRSRKSKAISTLETPRGPRPSGVQLSIKEFYRSKKAAGDEAAGKKPQAEAGQSSKPGSRKASPVDLNKKIPKSLRRRLLFD